MEIKLLDDRPAPGLAQLRIFRGVRERLDDGFRPALYIEEIYKQAILMVPDDLFDRLGSLQFDPIDVAGRRRCPCARWRRRSRR